MFHDDPNPRGHYTDPLHRLRRAEAKVRKQQHDEPPSPWLLVFGIVASLAVIGMLIWLAGGMPL